MPDFPRTEAGCEALYRWCAQRGVPYGWVMGATGSLWQMVAHYGAAQGLPVYVLNLKRVHALSQTLGRVAKPDAFDAGLIAACARVLREAGEREFSNTLDTP